MTKVSILYKGYSPAGDSRGHACSTVALVQDEHMNIITDPGSVPDPAVLFDALEQHGLTPENIQIVFITHSHFDHYKYVGLFPRAQVLEYWGLWNGDLWRQSDGVINPRIRAVNTPGHSPDSLSLLVETDEGTVAVCGDVFWNEDTSLDDPYAVDKSLLEESRRFLLETADFIVPGHGDMFKVTPKLRAMGKADPDRSSGE